MDERRGGAAPKHPDPRRYFRNPTDVELHVESAGTDPRTLAMRQEHYEFRALPGAVIFRVAVNSREPLEPGEKLRVWCSCTLNVKAGRLPWRRSVDILADEYWPYAFKDATVLPRYDYEYDDAYGYYLEVTYMGEELAHRPMPGYWWIWFELDMAEYLANRNTRMRVYVPELGHSLDW